MKQIVLNILSVLFLIFLVVLIVKMQLHFMEAGL